MSASDRNEPVFWLKVGDVRKIGSVDPDLAWKDMWITLKRGA